jgi:hypothetical protein
MQEHALEVGEELVVEGGSSLTLLAVEAGEVLLGITAPEPSDGAGPEARLWRPRMTIRPVPRASDQ